MSQPKPITEGQLKFMKPMIGAWGRFNTWIYDLSGGRVLGKFLDPLADKLRRGVGIRFKDRVRTDIEEYSITEGWVRVQAGKSLDRKGNPLTITLKGKVEPYIKDRK